MKKRNLRLCNLEEYRCRKKIARSLIKIMTYKDTATNSHSLRMQVLAEKMGKAVGLSDSLIKNLCLFAQFHDIGKLGISDLILNKAGSLTDKEKARMQQHCKMGYLFAKSIPKLSSIAGLILLHHEWWNGKGYPMHLVGEDIPFECRIMSIIDAYDAMTSDRPYRKALSREEAIAELIQGAGSQFDPVFVDVFIQIIK